MTRDSLPLVLGGHSFIPELGNDAPIDPAGQAEIVAACLDAGISWFDTTYAPERIGLGRALADLNRRDEATIIAWNFFLADDGKHLVGPQPYEARHLQILQEQLQTDRIDMLVVHGVGDAAADARQLVVAAAWQKAGHVGRLGVWAPPADPSSGAPYSFMVVPRNVGSPNDEAFDGARRVGWETLATSPFNRGWMLDQLVEIAVADGEAEPDARDRLAGVMLRFALHDDRVDRVVIGIRRTEWIDRNAAAVRAGALSADEHASLRELVGRIPKKDG